MASAGLKNQILKRRRQTATGRQVQPARQHELLCALPELCGLLDAFADMILVLNVDRQIVFANSWTLEHLGLRQADVIGLRTGDVLGCSHAWENDASTCGTGEACQTCGASKAIRTCEQGAASVQECRVLHTSTGLGLDLRASTRPLRLGGESFTLLVLKDISHEKRRQALERLFFHDMLNLTASIMGYAQLLTRVRPEEIPDLSQLIAKLVGELAGEIRAQRDLMLAERDDLKVEWEPVRSREMLANAVDMSRSHQGTGGSEIALDPAAADVTFRSDRSLLARVLCNLIKNALEASPPQRAITVGCHATGDSVEFWVHNHGTMPRDVQLQIFQRSFSTKGPGRGLGSYSIKLLTERYLNGKVAFTTSARAGTRFTVSYPRGDSA